MAYTEKQQHEDIEYLASILSKGITGVIAFGLTEGIQLRSALERITKSKKNRQVMVRLVAKYCLLNRDMTAIVEALSSMSPKLKSMFEKHNFSAKEAEPADPDVKEAEPC